MEEHKITINPEDLAYWYFRLNGCLCLQNFLIHDRPGREGTDADLIAVRFPYRKELYHSGRHMEDDHYFQSVGKIDLMIVEVKRGLCALNGPWTDQRRENLQKLLYVVGSFPIEEVGAIANILYENRVFQNKSFRVRMFALGARPNRNIAGSVIQITWDEVLKFIHERLTKFGNYKTQHFQWDQTGKTLYEVAERNCNNQAAFIEEIKGMF